MMRDYFKWSLENEINEKILGFKEIHQDTAMGFIVYLMSAII